MITSPFHKIDLDEIYDQKKADDLEEQMRLILTIYGENPAIQTNALELVQDAFENLYNKQTGKLVSFRDKPVGEISEAPMDLSERPF